MSWLLKDVILQFVVGMIIAIVITVIWKISSGKNVKWK